MVFERIASRTEWDGYAAVRRDTFRYADGGSSAREIVAHPGSVAIVAHDGEYVYLVRQPREAVDEMGLLELPAGRLEPGEEPLATAKRELAEEVAKGARVWRALTCFYTSPGFLEEECHLFLATDLYDAHAECEEEERIEIVRVSLTRLDETIGSCRDARMIAGLFWLRAFELH